MKELVISLKKVVLKGNDKYLSTHTHTRTCTNIAIRALPEAFSVSIAITYPLARV